MRPVYSQEPTAKGTTLWSLAAVLAAVMLVGCGSARQPGARSSETTGSSVQPAAATSIPSMPTPGRPVPKSALRHLTAIADRVVKVNGGRAPAWVSVVVTTHEKALTSATPGDTEPAGQRTVVYLITMEGRFVADDVSVPLGAHAPTGRYLSIVINARTFESLDFGLSPKPPPVSPGSFGPVTYLKKVR